MTATALVHVDNVGFRRGEREILRGVNLQLLPNRIVTLIGPNGAGKSTLVKLILGLERADSGCIHHASDLRIGYMPQKIALDSNLPVTVKRFLNFASQDHRARDAVLSEMGITHLADTMLFNVSGGELQRILLARAMLRQPNLLILDEPVQGVDVRGQIELYQLINRLKQRYGCAVLMVSHDLHLVMATTDEVLCLNQHVCCHGHPDAVSNDPEFIRLFGAEYSAQLSTYSHHHDHEHDMHGNVVIHRHTHEHCDHQHQPRHATIPVVLPSQPVSPQKIPQAQHHE